MSVRYINDRFLPDKAIDLIDEAASKVQPSWISSNAGGSEALRGEIHDDSEEKKNRRL